MAKVIVKLETPKPPPVKEATIVLSGIEAQGLARLLEAGVAIGTIEALRLTELSRELRNKVEPSSTNFRSVAYI